MTSRTSVLQKPDVYIEISRNALLHNLRMIRSQLDHSTGLLAVVKANAYGHGLVETATLLDGRVQFLGVASASEGIQLRQAGIKTAILLFGAVPVHDLDVALDWDLQFSLSSLEEALRLHEAAKKSSHRAKVHIKVDTGMGRMGLSLANAQEEIIAMADLNRLDLTGLYTHFPDAEKKDNPLIETQICALLDLRDHLRLAGVEFPILHAGNSAGLMHFPQGHFDMVRCGLMLFGVHPHPSLRGFNLEPVLSLKARLIHTKEMQKGSTVGYGRTYSLKTDGRIGILPVGYALGYPYQVGLQKAHVLAGGHELPLAGKVSMDFIAIDLSLSDLNVGDEVTLIGKDGGGLLSVETLAEWAGTIPYEILTRLSSRISRLVI